MASGFYSHKKALSRLAGHGDLDELRDLKEITPAFAKYIKEDLQQ